MRHKRPRKPTEFDALGYPLSEWIPVRDLRGPVGLHGPLGFYAMSPEQAEDFWEKHIKECNQCRRSEGLPFNRFRYYFPV